VELEYSDRNHRRSKVYMAAGIVAALLVAGIVFVALQATRLGQPAEVEMRTVVVAAAEIAGRQPITETDVTTREIPADPTNQHAFTSVDQAIGRVSSAPLSIGQLVGPSALASTTEGMTYSLLAPGEEFDPSGPDWRAVSVTVPAASAVGGTLTPGQSVDLIVTMPINPEPTTDGETAEEPEAGLASVMSGPSTKVTLQAMSLLFRDGDIYILRADLETAEKIAELTAAGGTFTMALRHGEDDRTADTEGSTIDRLIEEYDFPLPRTIETDEPVSAGN
jgi:Flp pilus assembly protein CpaB